MTQRATLQALDATLAAAFGSAGMADTGNLTPLAGGAALPCTVLIDRAAQFYDAQGEIVGTRVVVTLYLAEIPTPARRDTLVVGAETFKLEQLLEQDESSTRWVVVNG